MDVGDVVDQYHLTGILARNDVAAVFKAVDTCSGELVVVKIPTLAAESDLSFFERFRREEAIGQRLDHPNVVKVLRPRAKSREYIVMEYVEGRTLRALLEPGRPLETGRALDLVRQLCEALVHLHAHGVVHRDLKPENLVVDERGRIKILDLGIALDRSARRVTWGRLSHRTGTPDYMAPEQIAGRRGDARTDIYAVGVLLFELLTGALPFPADSALAMMQAKAHDEARLPSYFRPDLDPGIEAIVVRAIRRRPSERYGSAAELLAHLREPSRAVANADGRVEPHGTTRRRRTLMLVSIFTVLVALSSLIWLSSRAAESAREQAAGNVAP